MKWIAAGVEDRSSAAALRFAYRSANEIRAALEPIGADVLFVDGERHGLLRSRFNRSGVARCADRPPCPLEILRGDVFIAQAHPQRAIS